MIRRTTFKSEDFEGGKKGEGLNKFIKEFKKMKEGRLKAWISSEKNLSISERHKLKEALKDHYQWEDFKHHHWALVAKILNIEINIRTSRRHKSWISIKPDELCPEISIPTIPMKHNKRIWLENLQEDSGWHYNLDCFKCWGFGVLKKVKLKRTSTLNYQTDGPSENFSGQSQSLSYPEKFR